MQKVVNGNVPQYLKDFMIHSERLHGHGNKQILPRARTDIFKTSFSFSGSLAWNSLSHHLRYPMEVKTFKRNTFQTLTKPPGYAHHHPPPSIRQTPWHKMYCICPLACSWQVLHRYFTNIIHLLIYVFSYVIVLSFPFLVVIILMRYIHSIYECIRLILVYMSVSV